MVDVGTMEINGSINTSDIDSGIVRIEGALKVVETQAKQTQGSFDKLGISTVAIGSALGNIATKGVTALSGLAAKSPILGSSFAKIGQESLKLSNVLGAQLKPLFDEIGQSVIPSITSALNDSDSAISKLITASVGGIESLMSALNDSSSGISKFSSAFVTGLTDILNLFTLNFEKIEELEAKLAGGTIGAFIGGVLGFATGGIPGAIKGAGIGAVAGAGAGGYVSPDAPTQYSQYGAFAESRYMMDNLAWRMKNGGGDSVDAIGGTGAILFNLLIDTYQSLAGKDQKLSTANGTSLGE